ncbi:MAG TPA: BamA/TamA family outer membrane protein [Panacibacter sp.]|nr:BamA/TamA family outer membrane protein [Panacibacter sp.]
MFLLSMIVLFASCNTTKHLPQGEALYEGSRIKFLGKDSAKNETKGLKEELGALLRPIPNKHVAGLNTDVMLYNLFYTEKEKGFGGWLHKKVGMPPVLASSVDIDQNKKLLENRLENRGFFKASVRADTMVKDKKMHAVYTASLGGRYRFRNVSVTPDTGVMYNLLKTINTASLLTPGSFYNLDNVKAERTRIDSKLKQRGYYYFNPDFLIADADTTVGNHLIDVNWRVKKEVPARAKDQYQINDVVIYADYNPKDSSSVKDSAYSYKGFTVIDPQKKYRPIVFSNTIVLKKGDLYNINAHNQSLSRLVSLGIYKFVRVHFEETDTADPRKLNAYYYLSAATRNSLRFEVSGLTKSNNSNGGEIKLSWGMRNIFNGGELFNISVYGGLERQVQSQSESVKTDRAGIDFDLLIPRLIPSLPVKISGSYLPKTAINAGYELFNRTTQYTLSSAKASYGYTWKRKITQQNQLRLLSVNFVRPTNITEEYQQQLDTNITLARSIEKQFIFGTIFNYNYNSLLRPGNRKNDFYFNGSVDLAGNIIGLFLKGNQKEGNPVNIFGVPYSQYVRLEADFRHYHKITKTTVLASRFNAGIGYAYGNSLTMPFIKEFFSGGATSIRAFRARSVGPGTYYGGNPQVEGFLPDQPGDIKLEANTELRAKLFSYLYGAVFVDAGNVWLVRADSARPGGKFSKSFLKEVAMGTGVGLRLDVSFFVVRLDVAFPIRKPWNAEGDRWVFDKIAFGSSDWVKENLVYNIAIGYPF